MDHHQINELLDSVAADHEDVSVLREYLSDFASEPDRLVRSILDFATFNRTYLALRVLARVGGLVTSSTQTTLDLIDWLSRRGLANRFSRNRVLGVRCVGNLIEQLLSVGDDVNASLLAIAFNLCERLFSASLDDHAEVRLAVFKSVHHLLNAVSGGNACCRVLVHLHFYGLVDPVWADHCESLWRNVHDRRALTESAMESSLRREEKFVTANVQRSTRVVARMVDEMGEKSAEYADQLVRILEKIPPNQNELVFALVGTLLKHKIPLLTNNARVAVAVAEHSTDASSIDFACDVTDGVHALTLVALCPRPQHTALITRIHNRHVQLRSLCVEIAELLVSFEPPSHPYISWLECFGRRCSIEQFTQIMNRIDFDRPIETFDLMLVSYETVKSRPSHAGPLARLIERLLTHQPSRILSELVLKSLGIYIANSLQLNLTAAAADSICRVCEQTKSDVIGVCGLGLIGHHHHPRITESCDVFEA